MLEAHDKPNTVCVSNPKWFAQPVTVADMAKRNTAREILAANMRRLGIGERGAQNFVPQHFLVKTKGASQSTIGRALKGETGATLETLEAIARHFGLEAWQLLIEGFDPKMPPDIDRSNPKLLEFRRRVSELVQEMGIERRNDH